jgi:hypothetical protein
MLHFLTFCKLVPAAPRSGSDFPSLVTAVLSVSRRVRPSWNRVSFRREIAPHDGRGVYRAKSRNVSETRARMRSRSRSRRLPPPAPGFQLSSRGDGVPDQAATRSASRAAEYPPPCGRSEPGSRAKHALGRFLSPISETVCFHRFYFRATEQASNMGGVMVLPTDLNRTV